MKYGIKVYLLTIIIVLLLFFPLFTDNYMTHVVVQAGIYLILTWGLFLVVGMAGEIHLGLAGFWAIGSYISALLAVNLGVPFWLSLPIAAVVTAFFGLIIGFTTLKVSGYYLAMVTVGFGEIVRLMLLNWTEVTRGSMGVRDIPYPTFFGASIDTPKKYYLLCLFFTVVVGWVTYRLSNSRLGLSMRAMGNNNLAAESVGIFNFRYKVTAIIVCSAMAGVAGSLYAHYITYIHPDVYSLGKSIFFLVLVIVGSRQKMGGVVISTLGLTFLLEYLRIIGEFRMIVYAGFLILTVVFVPEGLGYVVIRWMGSLWNKTVQYALIIVHQRKEES